MHTINLNLKKRSYKILVGSNIINSLGKILTGLNLGHDAYAITNPLIRKKYGKLLENILKKDNFSVRFKIVPDSEKSKSLSTASSVIKDVAKFDKGRRIFIIAFGGGVIGDLSGFVASIYKRGVPYIQLPTTLLAQVDSSIGGKTAVDLPEAKNLIGAFYQPKLVLSDVRLLGSLSRSQIASGLAEVIKYGIIKDKILFSYLEKNHKSILAAKAVSLEHIVECSSRIKADIVSRDEKEEKGLRTILNFGHTVGHAIEAAGGYEGYSHGEAIALGMLVASDISRELGLINESSQERIQRLIKSSGLPTTIKRISLDAIINAHYHDKKFIGKTNRFVLINDIGRAKVVKNVPFKIIRMAVKKRLS